MEIGKKSMFYGAYILPCMNTSTYSPDSNKCGVPSARQFNINLGQHLIVIPFRGI